MNNNKQYYGQIISVILIWLLALNANAAEEKKYDYQDDALYLRFIQLTPLQIGSFYEGREFSKGAVDKLMASCYVTVIIKNRSNDFLWVDIAKWNFTRQGKVIKQQDRQYWDQQWDEINLKQAHRSTFNWTLMPAVRDLYPQESVGGRIPIPMQSEPFTVELNFPTGENKQGKMKTVVMDNVICKQDEK
ncbi:hypothetical protein [sulfur-oxidizing endosymbiont of Gigantopelta aegis]|uniref:hypothetical protein n=1 Tax=sulfur-oxidizing endosymbiont of Gigantopelta aegis TaxID=2794934 RepID=UPI0018DE0918|nr:hypothetical protein [sulfur-oxidizing endosymbiont of Gigantopelta aegis]